MPNTQNVHPKKHRAKFSASSLLLAGAISFAGLFNATDAFALAGTLTSSGTTTTPRESSGTSGGATLIPTAASSNNGTSSSSTQVSGPSDASSTPAVHTSGGTRRRAQTEEGGGHRRTDSTTGKTRGKAKATASAESKDAKETKNVAPVIPVINRPILTLSSGYESRYIYHGSDIVGFNSLSLNPFTGKPASSSGITYDNVDLAYAGAHLGVGYIRAISPTYPYLSIGRYNPSRDFYQEVDVDADYTASIIGGYLDATTGYDSYFYADRNYRGSSYQGDLHARLAYVQFKKWVVPSFNYFRYFSKDNLGLGVKRNGSYVEFRLDSSISVVNREHFGLEIAPYVAAGYNIDYLRYVYADGTEDTGPNGHGVGGWNDLEMGLKVNARIGKHLIITPYGNHGMDLHGSDGEFSTISANNLSGNGYGERTHFWGGVTVAYSF